MAVFLSNKELRMRGREPRGHECCDEMSLSTVKLRSLNAEIGLLKRADGSARLSQDDTKVLCAVYGPAEVKISKEQSDQATIEVTVKPQSGMSSPRERFLEEMVTSCCKSTVLGQLHPHTALSLTLQIENDDGMLLSTLVNCCCLALLDACVPLSSVFSALTCGYTKDGQLFTNLTCQQEKDCVSVLTFVIEDGTDNILTTHAQGAFSIEQLQQALKVAQEASKEVVSFYQQSIKRKLSKDAKYSTTET